jgi:hypothetical protein
MCSANVEDISQRRMDHLSWVEEINGGCSRRKKRPAEYPDGPTSRADATELEHRAVQLSELLPPAKQDLRRFSCDLPAFDGAFAPELENRALQAIRQGKLELEPPEKSAEQGPTAALALWWRFNCVPLSRWPIANQAGLPELSNSEKWPSAQRRVELKYHLPNQGVRIRPRKFCIVRRLA